jgi:hypothetical protein
MRGMVMNRRKPDRAQRERARRQWWERHGAFTRGFAVGVALTALAGWCTKALGWM